VNFCKILYEFRLTIADECCIIIPLVPGPVKDGNKFLLSAAGILEFPDLPSESVCCCPLVAIHRLGSQAPEKKDETMVAVTDLNRLLLIIVF